MFSKFVVLDSSSLATIFALMRPIFVGNSTSVMLKGTVNFYHFNIIYLYMSRTNGSLLKY